MRREVLIVGLLALATAACSSPEDDFCGALEDRFDLAALQRAIDAGDDTATTRALGDLQEVADLAPDDIQQAARAVIDTLIASVRAVTGAIDPNGESTPVDTEALSTALDGISPQSAELADYARTTCGFDLK